MTKLRYDYEPGFCGELLRDNGTTLCAFDTEPTAEDARRLVACWNACDGLNTEALERLGTIDRARVGLDVIRSQAIAQRDELLAALKEAENALADYIPTIERTGASLNYGHKVLRDVRAAIQKATNKDHA